MNSLTPMVLNVAVAGFCDHEEGRERVVHYLTRVLYELQTRASDYDEEKYGFSGEGPRINLIASPSLTDAATWLAIAKQAELPLQLVLPDTAADCPPALRKAAVSLTVLDKGQAALQTSTVIDWIADQADLGLMLWDGKESGHQGGVWALLQAFRRKEIPCIWCADSEPEKAYWAAQSYFAPYSQEKIKRMLEEMFDVEETADPKADQFRLSAWWDKLYDRFLKKYNAQAPSVTYEKDSLLDDGYRLPEGEAARQGVRDKMLAWFHQFDNTAIHYAQKYRSSIYLRAILPIWATLFLAVGFYAETLCGFLLPASLGRFSLWSVIAGVGFLIHALINYYAFKVAQSGTVKAWQGLYLRNRFLAEAMRLILHFQLYGIPVNIEQTIYHSRRRGMGGKGMLNTLHRIKRSLDFSGATYQPDSQELADHLLEMLEDQIAYQSRTKARYQAVLVHLGKWEKSVFWAGFLLILLRGLLQFVIPYLDFGGAALNGITLVSFVRSFANLLALFVPAWAAYFTSKLSLCNFENLMKTSEYMQQELTAMRDLVRDMRERGVSAYESYYNLSKDFIYLYLSDTTEWFSQLSSKSFTKL